MRLKVRYEGDINNSYLILENESQDDLAIDMLRDNQVRGLLPLKINKLDGVICFSYDISRFQSMANFLKENSIDNKWLVEFIKALRSTLEDLEDHMLKMDGLMLEPEYIYCDRSNQNSPFFCYSTENIRDSKSSIKNLSELILNNVSSNDSRVIITAYELFKRSREENFALSALDELIGKISPAEIDLASGKEKEEEKPESLTDDSAESTWEDWEKENWEDEDKWEDTRNSEEKDNTYAYKKEKQQVVKDRRFLGIRLKHKREDTKILSKAPEPSFAMEDTFFYGKDSKKENIEERIFESTSIKLVPDYNGSECISIDTYPYLIGNLPYAVDGCIENEEISKFHARFDTHKGKIYLSDLKSHTGTFLNGERLRDSTQREISLGDVVGFGPLCYQISEMA